MSRPQVIVSADVRTLDPEGTRADAIAWEGNTILAVGREDEVLACAGEGAIVSRANGATVVPGFVDAHHHPTIVALHGGSIRLVPPLVTSIASLQQALREEAKTLQPGEWVVGRDWDEMFLAERRPPTRAELDEAVPDQPVFLIHYSCHRALANSRALALAGIERSSVDPAGGTIERDARGEPNGLLVERGISRVETLARQSVAARDAEGFLARLGRHHDALVAAGITRVTDATVPLDMIVLYREAARRGLLKVPTLMLPVSTRGYLEAPWDVLEEELGESDPMLAVGPLKLVFDGAPGCAMCLSWWQVAGTAVRTWAMAVRTGSLDPVRASLSVKPRLGGQIRTGILLYRREEAAAIVRAASERGHRIATHAIGNEAVDMALAAYEGTKAVRVGTSRLEHATFLDRALVARIVDQGIAVVTQPAFVGIPSYASTPSVPGLANLPVRWLLDAGVTVAGSSDHPVIGFDPLDGLRAAVLRRTTSGAVFEGEQCIDLDRALVMFTRTAAEVSGGGGTLQPGKAADLVLLNVRLDEASLAAARVKATVIGGNVVFGSLDAP